MPSPPLSPVPRRWRSPDASQPSPDVQRLLSSVEPPADSPSASDPFYTPQETPSTRDNEDDESSYLSAPATPQRLPRAPEIRTTSPTPQRPTSPARSSEGRLSPLPLPPARGSVFDDPSRVAATRPTLSRFGSLTGPRAMAGRNIEDASPVVPQPTGGSVSAQYDDVFAQLEALSNRAFSVPSLNAPVGARAPDFTSGFRSQPVTSAATPPASVPPPQSYGSGGGFVNPARPTYVRIGENGPLWRPADPLEAVSERTEPLTSSAGSRNSSPASMRREPAALGAAATPRPTTPASASSLTRSHPSETPSLAASRFPLPPSPVKGPREAGPALQTPKKASDLIKMFERQGAATATSETPALAMPAATQPLFGPRPVTRLEAAIQQPPPPSSYRAPEPAPTPPPKSTSPLQSVRTMIASWRARAGSPSRTPSPGTNEPTRTSGLGRDRGWNVSIRRRRRHEGRDVPLGEQEIEIAPPAASASEAGLTEVSELPLDVPLSGGRSSSLRSIASRQSAGPRALTGEPIRTGTLLYLNVHDMSRAPDFEWVQADGRLYPEGLQLVWRTPSGAQAMVTLDLEYCDEVASTFSPTHPMAGDDIGALAAKRQGELARQLYPFKLVYDDGTERLGCDSARERVRWVTAIWTVLERSRSTPPRSPSHHDKPSSLVSGSTNGGGSSSTHFAPVADAAATFDTPSTPHLLITDDAIVETAGGFAAPIASRGSRRLAAGAERARSLRRVASEADLAEAASREELSPSPAPTPVRQTLAQLTPEEARSRPSSRDFTFAGGIPPPAIAGLASPPPGYLSPTSAGHTGYFGTAASALASPTVAPSSGSQTPGQTYRPPGAYPGSTGPASAYGTAQLGSVYSTPAPGSAYGMAAAPSTYGSATGPSAYGTATAPSAYGTVGAPSSYGTAQPKSEYGTAQVRSEYGTADRPSSPARSSGAYSDPVSLRTALQQGPPVPGVAVIGATPSEKSVATRPASSVYGTDQPQSVYGTAGAPSIGVTAATHAETTYRTPRSFKDPSEYASATDQLESVYTTADEPSRTAQTARDSSSTYDTAPPPVPSRDSHYSTATFGRDSTAGRGTPVRHQLYDPPVRSSASDASGTVRAVTAAEPTAYSSARPLASRTTTAASAADYATTEPTWSTPSRYTTAPLAPPTSRASFPSDEQDRASTKDWETGTHISEPDTDYALIADLERKSSSGSNAAVSRAPQVSHVYITATTGSAPYGTASAKDSARTVFGTADENSLYATARQSAYTTASQGRTVETYMTTALQGTEQTAKTSQTQPIRGPPPPASVSTAQSIPSSSRVPRKAVPPVEAAPPPPPPPPSEPSDPTSTSSSSVSDSTMTQPDYNMLRLINYLQGQEQARQGQTTRLSTQLDRMEGKIDGIAARPVFDAPPPPPLPSKDDDSPPSSPSSTTSTSSVDTARPVTPPPLIMPPSLTQRLDDMTHLLGTVLGQQNDIMQELARRRSFDVELDGSRNITLPRIEDLLRRLLLRQGEGDYPAEPAYGAKSDKAPSRLDKEDAPASTRDGSMYRGGDSVYSDPAGLHAPARPSSLASARRTERGVPSVSSSLLEGDVGLPEFDDEYAVHHLPPASPPHERIVPHAVPPPSIARRRAALPQQQTPAAPPVQPQEYYDDYTPETEYAEEEYEPEYEPEPVDDEEEAVEQALPPVPVEDEDEPDQAPIPYRPDEYEQDEDSYDDDDHYRRRGARQMPPPQPVDLPTPVNEEQPRMFPPPPMQPPFSNGQPGMMPGMMPEMPRPSLPRIAGVRDPISTTYFRRGFPPGPMGPMGPMGMFPGPMGMPGPGMGPFMPGLRPGLAGFGGPLGPNVAPGSRRPGFFPPGVPGTTGDYGLPAGARYGNNAPPAPGTLRPQAVADSGLGNTTSESTSPSPLTAATSPTPSSSQSLTTTEEQIITPTTSVAPLLPPATIATPGADSTGDDSFRRTLGNAQALAEAQGEQQNEMSRYLHGMSDQIADAHNATQKELGDILADIAQLRTQLRPERVHGHVLPDGTVQLSTGEIVDGIRGAPPAVPTTMMTPVPLPPSPAASHVLGKVLPDGTVMAGDKIVDGIKGAPHAPTAGEEDVPQTVKDAEQDRRLADLQDKIAELMARNAPVTPTVIDDDDDASTRGIGPTPKPTPRGPNTDITREKTYIKEREVIREGPSGHHRELEKEDITELDMVTTLPPPGTAAGTAAGGTVAATAPPGTVVATIPPGTAVANTGAPGTALRDPSAPGTAPLTGAGGTPAGSAPAGTVMADGAPAGSGPGSRAGSAAASGTKINPRTGKPLTLPAPLSLQPTEQSPIVEEPALAEPQLIREEHEEIVSRPVGGGMPTHTHTTTRTYTGLPGVVDGAPLQSLGDPATAATEPAIVRTVSGAHHSDHQSFVAANVPLPPSQRLSTERLTQHPDPVAVDTVHQSVSHTRSAMSLADPGNGGGGTHHATTDAGDAAPATGAPATAADPGGAGGGTAAPGSTAAADPGGKPKKEKEVWSTNKPKHNLDPATTTAHNISARNNEDAPALAAHDAPAGPAGQQADPGAGGDGGTPAGAADPVDGAAPVPASSEGKKGVHWDNRVPVKPVPSTGLHNVASHPEDDPGNKAAEPASHAGADDPASAAADPAGAGAAGPEDTSSKNKSSTKGSKVPSPAGSKHDEASKTSNTLPPVPSGGGGSVHDAPSGPPVVSTGASGDPLVAGGKDTRFSDVVHPRLIPANAHDAAEQDGGGGAGGPSKLQKSRPTTAAPGIVTGGGNPAAPELANDSGQPMPIYEEMTLPNGQKALVKTGEVPPRPASQGVPSRPASVKAPAQEPVALAEPTGAPGPNKLSKGKPVSDAAAGDKDKDAAGAPGATKTALADPAESQVGRGHCSYCCPNDARPSLAPISDAEHSKLHKAPPSGGSRKPVPPPGPIEGVPGDEEAHEARDAASAKSGGKPNKLVKSKSGLTPEEEALEDAKKLAAKQKAAAEVAAAETAEKERLLKEKEAKLKLAEDRHKQLADALADLRKLMATEQKALKTANDEGAKTKEKRRTDKAARDKKWEEIFTKLVGDKDEQKKLRDAEAKKPGTQAILDALKTSGDAQSAFLRKLATEVMEQNSNQHKLTQDASKNWAREQVGFNLAGYLDDFSKALSGEVRVLLKEVGDLRESRRALYMELAELLLMKGRQSGGDLMAVLPYPTKPPTKAEAKKAEDAKKPAQPAGQKPAAVPAWSNFSMPFAPVAGTRPLPNPGGAVPPPPPAAATFIPMPVPIPAQPDGARPLPQPKQ